MNFKYVASCSFGKDSLAMVLLLIEKKYPLDEIIFYDTGMEFESIYNNKDKLSEFLEGSNIKLSILKDTKSFEYKAFEKKIKKRDGTSAYGYDWCGGLRRWETTNKITVINKYYKEHFKDDIVIEYVGIAFDERERIEKYRTKRTKSIKLYPLVENGMTEYECLKFCYDRGWHWTENGVELYEILDRVSCWCCTNKNQKEIKNIITHLPKYWNKIKEYESKCNVPYKKKGCEYFEKKV